MEKALILPNMPAPLSEKWQRSTYSAQAIYLKP